MITVIADHVVNAGQMDAANKIFEEVTASAKKAKGLASRSIIVSQKDANRIITVTNWDSQEAFDAWRKVRKFTFDAAHLHKVFSKEVVEIYNVAKKV